MVKKLSFSTNRLAQVASIAARSAHEALCRWSFILLVRNSVAGVSAGTFLADGFRLLPQISLTLDVRLA